MRSRPEAVVTVKLFTELALPVGVLTEILPLVAPWGTVAVIWAALFTVKDAVVPLKETAVAPVKFVPLIVTDVPTWPEVGLKSPIVGPALVMVKLPVDVALPFGVVTLIFPVVAPLGTLAVTCVALFTVKEVVFPLNATEVAPLRFVPVMATEVPACPLLGVKLEMVGADAEVTVNVVPEVAVPPVVVTENFPVLAPVGTVAVIRAALLTAKDVAVPLSVTFVAPFRFVPVRTTLVPTGPLLGETLVMVGGLSWREGVAPAPPPQEIEVDNKPMPVRAPRTRVSRLFLGMISSGLCVIHLLAS